MELQALKRLLVSTRQFRAAKPFLTVVYVSRYTPIAQPPPNSLEYSDLSVRIFGVDRFLTDYSTPRRTINENSLSKICRGEV